MQFFEFFLFNFVLASQLSKNKLAVGEDNQALVGKVLLCFFTGTDNGQVLGLIVCAVPDAFRYRSANHFFPYTHAHPDAHASANTTAVDSCVYFSYTAF